MGELGPIYNNVAWAEAYIRQTGQRSRRIGQTVTCNSRSITSGEFREPFARPPLESSGKLLTEKVTNSYSKVEGRRHGVDCGGHATPLLLGGVFEIDTSQ